MRILICPLDWGMGHTTRMIPVAYRLIGEGHQVTFGGSRRQVTLIRNDLPEAGTIIFAGFTTRYSKYLPMYLYTAFRIPAFAVATFREHRQLTRLLKEQPFDMVISDNRMGLWTRAAKTVYVTHMLRIPLPPLIRFLEKPGSWLHRLFINRFDECRIPDEAGDDNLSGRLSHEVTMPARARYIGILSKFTVCREEEMVIPEELASLLDKPWSTLILSGPEPQRGLLRNRFAGCWSNPDVLLVVLEGCMERGTPIFRYGQVISVPHLKPAAMAAVIKGSREIFSRSGYTTIMELASLGRLDGRAKLIPTPGQTEQEYLARLHFPVSAIPNGGAGTQ